MEISPALHEIIVAVSRKAVDERMEELTVTRRDFDEVRVALQDLAAAQARSEGRIERLEAAVERLAEAQTRTEARLERLETAIERLTETQARTEARLEELVAIQQNIGAILDRFDARIADLRGWQLELRHQERAVAYFGPLLRRMRVVPVNQLEDELEAHLSQKEFLDLLELDLLVSGQPRYRPDAPQVWLAVEVSAVIDWWDVKRARERAALLRRVGYRTIPIVAGEYATPMAKEEALAHKMLLIQNGRAHFWEEALQEALSG